MSDPSKSRSWYEVFEDKIPYPTLPDDGPDGADSIRIFKMRSGEVFFPFVKRSLPNVTTPLFLSSSRNSARGPLSPVYLMPFVPKDNSL